MPVGDGHESLLSGGSPARAGPEAVEGSATGGE